MFEQFLTGLSFRKYGDWVESQLLESLGNVMFFMLLYDMENLDKFIKELMDINVQSEDSKEKEITKRENAGVYQLIYPQCLWKIPLYVKRKVRTA
ncbi:hypothetical protein OIU89_14525 [Escherichia coli]|nr:hypothetical protein [Escherichia coli]